MMIIRFIHNDLTRNILYTVSFFRVAVYSMFFYLNSYAAFFDQAGITDLFPEYSNIGMI